MNTLSPTRDLDISENLANAVSKMPVLALEEIRSALGRQKPDLVRDDSRKGLKTLLDLAEGNPEILKEHQSLITSEIERRQSFIKQPTQ